MTRLSTATLLAAAFGTAPALAATPFISELYFDPPTGNGDRTQEFLEISGASNQALDGLFLLQIENENNAFGTGTQGRVDLGFDLRAQQLGSNGRLVIASTNGGVGVTGIPAHVFDPASTLVQGTSEFFGYRGAPGLLTDLPANVSVNTENSGGTYLLIDIGSGAAPTIGLDFDTDDDGTLDLPAGYTVLDSVGLTSEPGEQNFGGLYGAVNFVVGTPGPDFDVDPSTLTTIDYEIEYIAREANSNAFFVANLTSGPDEARGGPDVPIVGARYVISAADENGGSQNGDPEVSIGLPYGLSPLTPGGRTDVVLGLRGDYNQSGAFDATDIDALFAGQGTLAAANGQFDLTPTAGVVDFDDAVVLVEDLIGTRIGDANLDGDVDVFQLDGGGDAQILTSNLGTTSGAGWAQGDFNGDGDVDVFQFDGGGDAQLLTSNLGFDANAPSLLVAADAASGTVTGTYDPSTGEVVIEIGSGIGVIGLESLTGGALAPSNLSNALAAVQAAADVIAFFSASALAEGFFDLGAIVAPGTSVADLGFAYTPIGGAQVIGSLDVVPEPTTVGFVALGGLALLRRRHG